jgi:hypothetical protein
MPRVSRRLILAAVAVGTVFTIWQFNPSDATVTTGPVATNGPVNSPETNVAPARTAGAGSTAPAAASPSAVVAFHEMTVDVPLLETALRAGEPAALRSFTVRLGPNRTAEVEVARYDELNDDEGVYAGTVRGAPDSQAVFSYVGLAHAGTVVLGAEQRAFYITATEDGLMRITELDLTRAPLCGQPLLAQAASP